jgi:hypothetical protein
MSRAWLFIILFFAVFLGVFFFEALQEYPKVDIIALELSPSSFLDVKVKTRGFVKYYRGPTGCDLPIGDFHLVPIPFLYKQLNSISDHNFGVVAWLDGPPLPPEGSYIEISGVIKRSEMWRMCFFHVYSWCYSTIGIEIISDTATLSVILIILLLLSALGKLVFYVLMHKRFKKALSSDNFGFDKSRLSWQNRNY